MIARFACFTAVTLVSLACITTAEANWFKEAGCSIARDIKRRNCWPHPFVCHDRHSVRAPLGVIVNNGWERQNTLGEHQFDQRTGELNEAGRLKVQWILTQAPKHHRSIFVYSPGDAELAAKRIENVQHVAAELVPQGGIPAVLQASKPAPGWPAVYVDWNTRAWQRSEIPPRIPYLEIDFSTSEE